MKLKTKTNIRPIKGINRLTSADIGSVWNVIIDQVRVFQDNDPSNTAPTDSADIW
jgi:hypothetical protein